MSILDTTISQTTEAALIEARRDALNWVGLHLNTGQAYPRKSFFQPGLSKKQTKTTFNDGHGVWARTTATMEGPRCMVKSSSKCRPVLLVYEDINEELLWNPVVYVTGACEVTFTPARRRRSHRNDESTDNGVYTIRGLKPSKVYNLASIRHKMVKK